MTIAMGIHWWFACVAAAQGLDDPRPIAQAAPADATCQATLPSNIWAADQLVPVVAELLARSASFRRQCAAIAADHAVSVAIRLTSRLASGTRARAEIRHYANGALRAVIDVPVTRDAPELLAHEFEHVLEQMDRLDLAAMERQGGRGVTDAGEGAFETTRAIEAGRAAAGEYFGWDRPHATRPDPAIRPMAPTPRPPAFRGR